MKKTNRQRRLTTARNKAESELLDCLLASSCSDDDFVKINNAIETYRKAAEKLAFDIGFEAGRAKQADDDFATICNEIKKH